MDINQLSKRFILFANDECADSSKLYETLSKETAKDEELLIICSHAKESQPIPNLFFGAVHYLLLKGVRHELADYYLSLVEEPKKSTHAFVHFKSFCEEYKEEIIHLLQTKLVQTNEVRRCAYLYPSFSCIYEKTNKPLALIEIGTSAGLQLLCDQYQYSYDGLHRYGNLNSPLSLSSEIIGENVPSFKKEAYPVHSRCGIDLHINDLRDQEDRCWLKALIWPEHMERRNEFEAAASILKENVDELNLIEGDGIELLPQIVEGLPQNVTVCVFHTHVANQMPLETKKQLLQTIDELGRDRDVFHLYNNISDRFLHLDSYIDGRKTEETLAETAGHGEWFSWNVQETTHV
ncbi:DUF2332 domain-containing protein [Alkalihalophilus marmarensis]|uniref:DUF2332 domain-containing protein n=1 Tax=Alkalihalophilus marmarensis TaxID=521377 RepID=UPI002E233A9D|nr:DUF2332 domain-containing protein [Alkalihalophilus marmarensis]